MAEYIMRMLSILLYLFEGYCIQFFFGRFAEPKLRRLRNAQWAVGIVWILIRIASGALFRNADGAMLVAVLIFKMTVLFIFCAGWYKGNIQTKIFLTIQFISLRELAFWAGYSFLYIGNSLMDFLIHRAGGSLASAGYLPVAAGVLACISVAFVEVIECVLLLVSIRKIVESYHCREKGKMDKEVVFYLLPAVAGWILIARGFSKHMGSRINLLFQIPQIHNRKGGDIMIKINPLSTLYVGIDVSSKSNYVCALDFYKSKYINSSFANNQPGAEELTLKILECL